MYVVYERSFVCANCAKGFQRKNTFFSCFTKAQKNSEGISFT